MLSLELLECLLSSAHEHILCLLLLDKDNLNAPHIIRLLVHPKGEQSQWETNIASDGTLCFGPIKYIKKIVCAYESMFPKLSSSPLDKKKKTSVYSAITKGYHSNPKDPHLLL